MVPLALNLLYLLLGLIALPWVVWRRLAGGRPVAAPWQRLTGSVTVPPCPPGAHRIWLHGVSVGEVQLLATLVAELNRQAAARGLTIDCVVSSSTTTGLDLAARRFGPERVFPCPLDVSWAIRRVFRQVQPDLLVLGELELWPTMLHTADTRGVPVAVVNGRMSPRSFRGYSRVAPLARAMLRRVSLVLARSAEDAERFRQLGGPAVEAVGSLKFDGVIGDRQAAGVRHLRDLAGLSEQTPVLLAGSTQAPEEALAVEAFLTQRPRHPDLRLILVPRHAERAGAIAAWLDSRLADPAAAGIDWQRRSDLTQAGNHSPAAVLLVDVTGELASWWGVATVAFVGGSLDGGRGGQNMIEPSAYGAAVCFGPHTRNFRTEVAELLTDNAAVVVEDGAALCQFVGRCLDEPQFAAGLGTRARQVVARNRGATATTGQRLLDLLATESEQAVVEPRQKADTDGS